MATEYSPEIQAKLAKACEVKAAHQEALFKLAGVHAISVRPKITRDAWTTEFAIVVHVVRKRPAAELKPDEMIPPVIDGVSTDVIESAPRATSAAPSTEPEVNHYPHVVGGALIVSDSQRRGTVSRAGTLGCVAINQDPAVTALDKKAVALTNAHVVLDVIRTTTHDGAAVGQPDTSSLCCMSVDHTIGHLDRDAQFTGFDPKTNPKPPPTGIDAAFVTLDPGVQWAAEVIATGEGGSITTEQVAGSHPVDPKEALFDFPNGSAVPVPIYAVHKRGARTQATTGWLVAINMDALVTETSLDGITRAFRFVNQLEIQPQDPTKHFSLHGDSGSVILNSSSQVVGLFHAGPDDHDPPSTTSFACPIAEVQTRLKVLVADSKTFPGIQTVPRLVTPHAFAALPAGRELLRERLEMARAELGNTELGRALDSSLHRHFSEIRGLVNANKRVAAVWRRIHGPAWISAVLNCLLDRERPLPTEIEGRILRDCLDQLAAVLNRHGSEALMGDLITFGPELRGLSGRSYNDTLAAWRMRAAM